MHNEDTTEVSYRVTAKLRRIIEEVVENGPYYSKSQFVRDSIDGNIDYIQNNLKGQKSIRDFIKDLNSDVEWLNINLPEQSISTSFEPDRELSIVKNISLDSYSIDKLDKCSRCSEFKRSGIIRMCLMKEAYNERNKLSSTNKKRVEDRWLSMKVKLTRSNDLVIDQLFYAFSTDFILNKATDEREIGNMLYIADNYNKFKTTEGYEYVKSTTRGEEFIDTIEAAIEKI
jgi:Arc/MetJ-type ribon-helix-helix transcriptional regulator